MRTGRRAQSFRTELTEPCGQGGREWPASLGRKPHPATSVHPSPDGWTSLGTRGPGSNPGAPTGIKPNPALRPDTIRTPTMEAGDWISSATRGSPNSTCYGDRWRGRKTLGPDSVAPKSLLPRAAFRARRCTTNTSSCSSTAARPLHGQSRPGRETLKAATLSDPSTSSQCCSRKSASGSTCRSRRVRHGLEG